MFGRTSTQIKYASELLTKFANFKYTERDLKDGIKALRDSFDSISEQGISAQLGYYAATATKQGPFFFSKNEISAALDRATLEGLTNFHNEYIASIFIDIFSHGIESPEKIVSFANKIADLAEQEDHHPEILIEWGKVTVTWWSHKIKGLHKNDFICAAKTDQI